MKKIFTLFAAVVCGLTLSARTLYLNPGVWETDGAKFAMYYFNNENDNGWSEYMSSTGSVYEGSIPDSYTNVIFVRLNPNGGINWDSKWNQTSDLAIPANENQYNITGWNAGEGNWSAYGGGTNPGGDTPGGGGDNELEESGEYHQFGLMGSIGGDWNIQELKDEYMFDSRGRWSGMLASHPQKDNISYIVITDEEGNQYKTKGWQGENATKVTLYWANGFEDSNVWQLPAGQTLYLIMRSCTFKGSIDIERVDQATYDAYTIDWGNGSNNEAIDNTVVNAKAHKMVVNGQLRIVRGDKVFDATGREL